MDELTARFLADFFYWASPTWVAHRQKGKTMAYIITVDHITDGYSPPKTNLHAHGLSIGDPYEEETPMLQFRLLDDDDELYYEGVVSDDEYILDVLDWATANAGATQMLTSPNGVAWTHVN